MPHTSRTCRVGPSGRSSGLQRKSRARCARVESGAKRSASISRTGERRDKRCSMSTCMSSRGGAETGWDFAYARSAATSRIGRSWILSRVVEFSDPPSYLLVLGHDDRHERPVTADRLLKGREKRLVLEAQMGHQFLREESDGFVEDDVVPLARLAGRHHLVQGGLEFREFVDEILVHSDERSEGIVRRFAHRLRLPTVGVKACASRCEPRRRPRERYGVPDVLELADPLDEA